MARRPRRGRGAGEGPRSLPFFSRLNFKIAAERLESAGFRVSLRQVPTPPNRPDPVGTGPEEMRCWLGEPTRRRSPNRTTLKAL